MTASTGLRPADALHGGAHMKWSGFTQVILSEDFRPRNCCFASIDAFPQSDLFHIVLSRGKFEEMHTLCNTSQSTCQKGKPCDTPRSPLLAEKIISWCSRSWRLQQRPHQVHLEAYSPVPLKAVQSVSTGARSANRGLTMLLVQGCSGNPLLPDGAPKPTAIGCPSLQYP